MSKRAWILFFSFFVFGIIFVLGIILAPVILAYSGDSEEEKTETDENSTAKVEMTTTREILNITITKDKKDSSSGL